MYMYTHIYIYITMPDAVAARRPRRPSRRRPRSSRRRIFPRVS